jgi:hypothetical protein
MKITKNLLIFHNRFDYIWITFNEQNIKLISTELIFRNVC